jgi:hypothetical protein
MFRKAMVGDGSTLWADFTTGVLDSRFTFTRASTTATYINSSGNVQTASTNVPRFDHDPTTQAPRGLLVEGQATNLLNWSASFATTGGTNNNWADTNITRSTFGFDPTGVTTAITFSASAGNATIISSAAIGTSAARTFSVWLRRVSGTGDIQYTQNNGTNWTTQAITSTWTRYSFTHTVDHRVGIRIVTSGDLIEMWGAQLETGSGASSYIPTGASQATRVQDSLSCVSPNFAPWYQAATGTLLTDVTYTALSGNQSGIQFADATGASETNRLAIRRNIAIATRAGVTSAQFSPTATGRAISAFAYANADYKFSQNGASFSLVAGGTGNVPQNIDRLVAFTPGPEVPYGWVRRIKFWPTALPQATLNSITTL